MKCVYIAGPFRGDNAWEVENNIRRAETLALQVWRLGAAAICPHANTRFFSGTLPDVDWLTGDLEILRRCDAVIVTDDWRRSEGARAEVAEAYNRGLPVFTHITPLEEWLRVQVEADASRKTQAEREQYFNPRLEESDQNQRFEKYLDIRRAPSS